MTYPVARTQIRRFGLLCGVRAWLGQAFAAGLVLRADPKLKATTDIPRIFHVPSDVTKAEKANPLFLDRIRLCHRQNLACAGLGLLVSCSAAGMSHRLC